MSKKIIFEWKLSISNASPNRILEYKIHENDFDIYIFFKNLTSVSC